MRFLFAIVLASFLGIPHAYSSLDRVWAELTPMPEGRSGMIAIITQKLEPAYYGGSSWDENGKRIHATGFVYRDNEWRPLISLKNPIAYAAVARNEGLLYIAGGTDGSDLKPSLLSISPHLQQTTIEINPSQAHIYAGAAFVEHAFYLLGGSTKISPLTASATISKFEQGSWENVGQLPEGSLINPAVVSFSGNILVFGGGILKAEGLKNTDSVYSFATANRAWTKVSRLPDPIRGAVALSIPDTGILLIGGYIEPSTFSSQVVFFDHKKKEFHSLARLPMGLMLPGVVATEKYVYVFGGENAPKHRSNRLFRAPLTKLMQIIASEL